MDPILVSIGETAKILSVGRTSVYRFIQEGRLKTTKLGRRNLVTMRSIKSLAEASEA
jgi:excisionase family DNA binding protein